MDTGGGGDKCLLGLWAKMKTVGEPVHRMPSLVHLLIEGTLEARDARSGNPNGTVLAVNRPSKVGGGKRTEGWTMVSVLTNKIEKGTSQVSFNSLNS